MLHMEHKKHSEIFEISLIVWYDEFEQLLHPEDAQSNTDTLVPNVANVYKKQIYYNASAMSNLKNQCFI